MSHNDLKKLVANRISEIEKGCIPAKTEGTTYYVSACGNDNADGLSPKTPWKTTQKVSAADLKRGDSVLFRRGDVFRGEIIAQSGVTYSAYGEGKKPCLYGWKEDLANPNLWELYNAEHSIWKYTDKIYDCGTLVFNHGEKHSLKHIPSFINGRYVCREDESRDFLMQNEMQGDLDIYWHTEELTTYSPIKEQDFPIPALTYEYNPLGDLYLCCRSGNPGELFSSIEAVPKICGIRTKEEPDVTISNITFKYIGIHGVAAGGKCVKNLRVEYCDFGWIGGTIQNYFGLDPNYPEGGRGTVTRYGNGVEIYGGCDNYIVSNCYFYEIYDAGATHQVTTNGDKYIMENIRYENNVFDKCVYGIEYFLDMTEGDHESYMKNIRINGNIFLNGGYGWGQQRHNKHTPALIKGWSYVNAASDFEINDNIFCRSAYRMLHLVAEKGESCPKMQGNTYIQALGGMLGQYGGNEQGEPPILSFDENIEETVKNILGDSTANIIKLKSE